MNSDPNDSTSINKHPPTTDPSTANTGLVRELIDKNEAPETPYYQPAFVYDFSRSGTSSADERASLPLNLDQLTAQPSDDAPPPPRQAAQPLNLDQLTAQPGDDEILPPKKQGKPRKGRPAQSKNYHSGDSRKASNPTPDTTSAAANSHIASWATRRKYHGPVIHKPLIWSRPHGLAPNEFAKTIYEGTRQGAQFETAIGPELKSSIGRQCSRVPIVVIDVALELTARQFRDHRLTATGCSIQRIQQFVVRFAEVFEVESMVHPTVRLVDLAKDAAHALTALCWSLEAYNVEMR